MPFVKINQYHINLDSISYVEDDGKQLHVHLTHAAGAGAKLSCSVDRGSAEGGQLLRILNESVGRIV
jgi:hypothetical protein